MNPLKQYLSLSLVQQEAVKLLYSCANSLSHCNAAEGEMWGIESSKRGFSKQNYEQAREYCLKWNIPQEVMDAVMEDQLV